MITDEIQGELERRLQHLESALQRQDNAIIELKALLTRAADALEATRKFGFISREVLDANGITEDLITELRKAAE
jgi:hypothetical protein